MKKYLPCILVTLYCVVSCVANVCSCRSVQLFGFWSTDFGSLIFPLIFVLRDLIHKHTDMDTVKWAILLCAISNAFMFLMFWLTAICPADPYTGPQTEFGAVLLVSGRIIAASLLTLTVVEYIDALVYERVSRKHGKGVAASAVSNVVSIPLDSLMFSVVGFLGVFPIQTVISIFITNVIIKTIMTAICLPLSKKAKRKDVGTHEKAA